MTTDRPGFFPLLNNDFQLFFFIYFCSDSKYRLILDMLIIQQTDLFLQCFTYIVYVSVPSGYNTRPAIIYLQQNVAPLLQLMMKRCVSFPLLFKQKQNTLNGFVSFKVQDKRVLNFYSAICQLSFEFLDCYFFLLQIKLELFDYYTYMYISN